MNKSAILHIPVSQFAFAQDESIVTIRIRVAKGDIDSCTLFYGDRADNSSPVKFKMQLMQIEWQDELYDFYEVTIEDIPRRFCYYFKLTCDKEWIYLYADQYSKLLPDIVMQNGFVLEARSEYYQYPYIMRNEIIKEPEWFLNAIVYNIFPDSFASEKDAIIAPKNKEVELNGYRYQCKNGGTINGIYNNLEYIKDLGFNCIYLNPIFPAGEYHKYDILDYFGIDPCLGTEEDFLRLTNRIHELNMHIIIDGVFNHCSWYFPYFIDVVNKGKSSKYFDWFYEVNLPIIRVGEGEIPNYACFAYERKMPKLNTSNQEVQEYFAKVGHYWIEKYHIDGWRLDVANEVDRGFWRKFRKTIKKANPEAVLIGEVWENAENWLRGDMFDSTMNYDFRKYCRDYFAKETLTAEEFLYKMTDMQLRYPIQVTRGQLNLLDSHDVCRFLSLCEGNIEKWKAAFLYLFMAPGVPSVFYGDEKLICGFIECEYRNKMPWSEEHKEIKEFIRRVIHIRKTYLLPTDKWKIVSSNNLEKKIVFDRIGRWHCRITISSLPNEKAESSERTLLLEKENNYLCVELL